MAKASLDQAISATSDKYDVQVKWLPFFLRPNMPSEGVECGSGDGSGTAPSGPYWHDRIDRARTLGIDMSGGVAGNRFPNTTLTHVLLTWAWAQDPARQHELAELIFEAFYAKEIFLNLANLVDLADKAGYDAVAARRWLESKRGEAAVKAEARKSGVSGVPYFYINGKAVFSGAQDPHSFINAFAKAVQERPLPPRCPKILDQASIDAMSIKELKRLLLERGANPITVRLYVEKRDFAEAIMEMQRAELEKLAPKRLKTMLRNKGMTDPKQFSGAEKAELIQYLLQDVPTPERTTTTTTTTTAAAAAATSDNLSVGGGDDDGHYDCSGDTCQWVPGSSLA